MKKKIISYILIYLISILIVGCSENEVELEVHSNDASTAIISGNHSDSSNNISENENIETMGDIDKEITVYICGAINNPGVYTFEGDARIVEAIKKAGGFTKDAHTTYLNQASNMADGEKVYIPTKKEVESGSYSIYTNADSLNSDGKVNINTADKSTLMSLTGIGDSKAEAILSYRNEKGNFKTIGDICNVSGIGNSVYNSIKDYIRV